MIINGEFYYKTLKTVNINRSFYIFEAQIIDVLYFF